MRFVSRRQILTGAGAATYAYSMPLRASESMDKYAQTAWRYFDATRDPGTGLVPSAFGFPSMTMWDEGAYILAIVAATRLDVLHRDLALDYLAGLFDAIAALPLYEGRLPNKAYNTSSLDMTDYANKASQQGIGYSALDILRFLSGMAAAVIHFPELAAHAKRLLRLWDLESLHHEGRLQGVAELSETGLTPIQEGRIGYEQYGARVALLYKLPVELAAEFAPILRWQNYFDIKIPGDRRSKDSHGVSSITTSEAFMLSGLEHGWDAQTEQIARAVYDAQRYRAQRTGYLTALSEDHIKGPPYFAYHALLNDRTPFVSVTARRKDVSDLRCLSSKAAFGWHALIGDAYSEALVDTISDLQTPQGWYAGRFESDGRPNQVLSLNTNAVILEALHYQRFGPLLRV